jgi:hypothetical protein
LGFVQVEAAEKMHTNQSLRFSVAPVRDWTDELEFHFLNQLLGPEEFAFLSPRPLATQKKELSHLRPLEVRG